MAEQSANGFIKSGLDEKNLLSAACEATSSSASDTVVVAEYLPLNAPTLAPRGRSLSLRITIISQMKILTLVPGEHASSDLHTIPVSEGFQRAIFTMKERLSESLLQDHLQIFDRGYVCYDTRPLLLQEKNLPQKNTPWVGRLNQNFHP